MDYEHEHNVKQWYGIQSYHESDLNGDGSFTVQKVYKIDPGKLISENTLDKLYKDIKTPLPSNKYPQPFTGVFFS